MADTAGIPSPSTSQSSSPPVTAPPMTRQPRTIVLCFDGTSNEYDADNTNVVKFVSLLKKDSSQQVVYYQAGIGTYFSPGVVSPIFQWCAKILDEAIAWYLSAHVMDGYKFLMQNYNVGDKVCLFGFSRGAYTARALAGMIHKVGVLSRDNMEQVPFAYKLYKSSDTSNAILAQGFKETFCRDVPIEFLGAWDTVASVGVIMGRSLPFTSSNTAVRTFRQGLSLDEHRAKFRPSLYIRPMPINSKFSRKIKGVFRKKRAKCGTDATPYTGKAADVPPMPGPAFKTNVKEVWFAGCHTDVGGGSTPDSTQHCLSNIPLRWMIREVMRSQCGIVFDNSAFARLGIPLNFDDMFDNGSEKQKTLPDFFTPDGDEVDTVTTASGISSTLDAQDAVQPIHDALVEDPAWWILEVVPTNYTYQSVKTDQMVSKWSIHCGRGRWVPPNAMFHTSVKLRMEDPTLNYKPRAQYTKDTVTFVN